MPYIENEPNEDVNGKLEDIKNLDYVSEQEKELAFRIGTQIFDINRDGNEYPFDRAYAFILDAFDIVYDMLQSGRNNKNEIEIMKSLAKDSEKLFRYFQRTKTLIERIDTNAQVLEKRIGKENTERKKIIENIIGEMRNQKLT